MESHAEEAETLDAFLGRVRSVGGDAVEEVGAAEEAGRGAERAPRAELLRGVQLKVRVELGRARIPLKEALDLAPGSVLELDQLADAAVDIYVNDLLLARGEILVVDDCFCVRIHDVLAHGGEDAS
jgi:flagellar motor switch protein FliN/FliY